MSFGRFLCGAITAHNPSFSFELTNTLSSLGMKSAMKMRSPWRSVIGLLSAETHFLLVSSLTAVPLVSHDTATGLWKQLSEKD